MDDQDTVEKKSWCKLLIDGSILKYLRCGQTAVFSTKCRQAAL